MGVTETSLRAYHSVALTDRERDVMRAVHRFYGECQWFTRAELAKRMEWPINRITGRVLELLEKGYLQQDKGRTVVCQATGGDAHPVRLHINERRVDSACQASAPSPTVQGADCENDGANPSPLTLQGVTPVFEKHRMSMTPEQAERLLAHPNAKDCDQYKEAMRVKASGRYYVEI